MSKAMSKSRKKAMKAVEAWAVFDCRNRFIDAMQGRKTLELIYSDIGDKFTYCRVLITPVRERRAK